MIRYLILVVFIFVSRALSLELTFEHKPDFESYKTTSSTVMSVRNIIHCAQECIRLSQCVSFYFKSDGNLCKLNSVILWDINIVPFESGWKYYERKSRNIALNKQATQSSTYKNSPEHYPSYAVDGLLLKLQYALKCTTTEFEISPWLSVDMGKEETVDFVTMYNRFEALGERLHDVHIELGMTATSYPQTCGFYRGPAVNAQVVLVACVTNSVGRYLRIAIDDSSSAATNLLTLCEVEIHVAK